jgi:hypothetical protein
MTARELSEKLGRPAIWISEWRVICFFASSAIYTGEPFDSLEDAWSGMNGTQKVGMWHPPCWSSCSSMRMNGTQKVGMWHLDRNRDRPVGGVSLLSNVGV